MFKGKIFKEYKNFCKPGPLIKILFQNFYKGTRLTTPYNTPSFSGKIYKIFSMKKDNKISFRFLEFLGPFLALKIPKNGN